MAIPESSLRKSALRSTMRQLLRNLKADSRPVCEALRQWLAAHPRLKTIAVFSALPGEIDLSDFITLHPEIRWTYPRVIEGNGLKFHQVQNPSADLLPGNFSILEPSPTLPEIQPAEIDAFICPGLAFDQSGGRLGRGKGYYDRILEKARPDALKIGVCFPEQIVPDTFPERHDIHMDEVIY
ncbi:MAG: 5-formyltetrahydrofolate cyclo-ligase [Luteolibacter sp.]